MASSVLSVTATIPEASLPTSMYLRTRYKKLQRCKVSRSLAAQPADQSSTGSHDDPSFQAIRALNSQSSTKSGSTVVHAIIQDQTKCTPRIVVSSEYHPQSFSARVDKLPRNIKGDHQSRIAPSDQTGKQNVLARDSTQTGTGPQVSTSIGLPGQRSYTPVISSDQQQALRKCIQEKIAKPGYQDDNQDKRGSVTTVVRRRRHKKVDPRVVRIQGRDGVQCNLISPIPLNYERAPCATTPSISDTDTITSPPSPLDYTINRRPLRAKIAAQPARSDQSTAATAGRNAWLSDMAASEDGSLLAQSNFSFKERDDQPGQHEKNNRIIAWLHRVKDAVVPKRNLPSGISERNLGVFRDDPFSNLNKGPATPKPRTEKGLKDVTNVRLPAHLETNSFAQERHMQRQREAKAKDHRNVNPQPLMVPLHPPAKAYIRAHRPHADVRLQTVQREASTDARTALQRHRATQFPSTSKVEGRTSSQVTMVRPERRNDELHPDVAFALARLEGRVPPPPASPVQRRINDADNYDPHVESELRPLRLRCPRAVRHPNYGTLTEKLEDSINTDFDSALEAPLSPEAKTIQRSQQV
ncbi:MAG: hypothetical protein Q9219_001073 [cf. Caloplaca sp. 3 TL-2023]